MLMAFYVATTQQEVYVNGNFIGKHAEILQSVHNYFFDLRESIGIPLGLLLAYLSIGAVALVFSALCGVAEHPKYLLASRIFIWSALKACTVTAGSLTAMILFHAPCEIPNDKDLKFWMFAIAMVLLLIFVTRISLMIIRDADDIEQALNSNENAPVNRRINGLANRSIGAYKKIHHWSIRNRQQTNANDGPELIEVIQAWFTISNYKSPFR
jgi:hypothetical protein